MNLHRFASRRIAAKSRGDSESLSMRPLALLSVVPECSCRESGGFSFRVHKFSRSKDLKTLDPRQHRSGKTEILDQSLNSPPDGSPGKFSAMRSEQILQRTWFSVREFSAAKGCKFSRRMQSPHVFHDGSAIAKQSIETAASPLL